MKRAAYIAATLLACALPAFAATPTECWKLRKAGHNAQPCFEQLTQSSPAYERAEGYWGLEQWDQANAQFRLATQLENSPAHYKVRWGELLHQRFNNSDAAGLFRETLAKDPNSADAYLGLATLAADNFDGRASDYANKALALDQKLTAAHELLADVALINDDRDTALAEADKALAIQQDSLDAMAIHAAFEILADRSPETWFTRIHAATTGAGPGVAETYARVGRQLELHYRYEDAVPYYRKAVAADPNDWAAHSALGIDLMRLGQQDEPYKELELSYNNGHRDAATVNSLRLIDSYKTFETHRDSNTIIKLNKTEAALLLPYIQAELHTILATYEKKYKMTLPEPVQLEVYPNHEDFAVRTTGMPGLGALGVTFGEVVAMDSPSARKPGDFNWGATIWHEMSHVFILTATNHRVPRWFTEGLAVHEEGQRSPEWRNRLTPDVVAAIRDKKLLPVAKLDRGFVSPEYPAQVIVSYFQAGSICDFIGEKWGQDKLLDIVHSYAALETTPNAIQKNLGITAEQFDTQFLAWINQKYGNEATHFDEWHKQLKQLVEAMQQKQYDVVLKDGPAVLAMYPEYVEDANVYELMAIANRERNDAKSEAMILANYVKAGGESPNALKRLAELQTAAGDNSAAAATLEHLNYIYPVKDEGLHRKLGDLLFAQKKFDSAIREYNAVVASNPLDRAGAEYSLAQAYLAAGQKDKAEDSVLAALEAAPGYRPAQKLLLELNGSPAKSN
jgi:cellulose synthase operon protein C